MPSDMCLIRPAPMSCAAGFASATSAATAASASSERGRRSSTISAPSTASAIESAIVKGASSMPAARTASALAARARSATIESWAEETATPSAARASVKRAVGVADDGDPGVPRGEVEEEAVARVDRDEVGGLDVGPAAEEVEDVVAHGGSGRGRGREHGGPVSTQGTRRGDRARRTDSRARKRAQEWSPGPSLPDLDSNQEPAG